MNNTDTMFKKEFRKIPLGLLKDLIDESNKLDITYFIKSNKNNKNKDLVNITFWSRNPTKLQFLQYLVKQYRDKLKKLKKMVTIEKED